MLDRALQEETSVDRAGGSAATPAPETGVHPVSIEVALGAAIWFLAVTWVGFARGGEVDWDLVVATLFFIGFFALFLLAASYAMRDARWRLPPTSFRKFLDSPVGTATGTMCSRCEPLPNGGTEVKVEMDMSMTGRMAEYGRGMMRPVSRQLTKRFADAAKRELEAAGISS